jgi:hypothetical protein
MAFRTMCRASANTKGAVSNLVRLLDGSAVYRAGDFEAELFHHCGHGGHNYLRALRDRLIRIAFVDVIDARNRSDNDCAEDATLPIRTMN